ncbi:MAG: diguanylate cyclase, partial [Phycisphaerae bacterium]|nr:diguanylate cyclase [Phycisphaerae bacterium]
RPCCVGAALTGCDIHGTAAVLCGCAESAVESCCAIIGSLATLATFDLSTVDVVIATLDLPDGTGLDALEAVRAVRSELPVIIAARPEDADRAAEVIRAGALDFVVCASGDQAAIRIAIDKSLAHHRERQENNRLHRELADSLAELERKNTLLEELIEQLERKSRTDELTQLSNRRWLNLMLQGSWAEAMRYDLPLACLMIDLDGFKLFNDRLGHQAGDQLLREAATLIEANSRQVDVSARYGGDEFCILMPHTEAREATRVARRIVEAWGERRDRADRDEPRVGMTIGIAHVDLSRPRNPDELVRHADEALYAGKEAGKNRVVIRRRQGIRAVGCEAAAMAGV